MASLWPNGGNKTIWGNIQAKKHFFFKKILYVIPSALVSFLPDYCHCHSNCSNWEKVWKKIVENKICCYSYEILRTPSHSDLCIDVQVENLWTVWILHTIWGFEYLNPSSLCFDSANLSSLLGVLGWFSWVWFSWTSLKILQKIPLFIDFARNSNCSKIFRFIIEAEVLNEVVVVST